MNWMDIRIGQGYDVHALVEGRKLIDEAGSAVYRDRQGDQ